MWSSGPLRLSGYCGTDAGGWLAWLRDAERPRDEGQAAAVPVVAAASRRRLAPRPERRKARDGRGRRGPAEPAGPRHTAGAGRLRPAPGRNRARIAAEGIAAERDATER